MGLGESAWVSEFSGLELDLRVEDVVEGLAVLVVCDDEVDEHLLEGTHLLELCSDLLVVRVVSENGAYHAEPPGGEPGLCELLELLLVDDFLDVVLAGTSLHKEVSCLLDLHEALQASYEDGQNNVDFVFSE